MKYSLCMLLLAFLTCTGCGMNNYHSPYAEENKLVGEVLYNTAIAIEKKYKMKPIEAGAAMPGGEINRFHMSYDVRKSLSKNELRIWLVEMSQVLLNQITRNEQIERYLIKTPFTIDDIDIVIFNHDKDGRRIYDPAITVADISGGIITYETKDPNQEYGYKNTYTETYEEALKIIQSGGREI